MKFEDMVLENVGDGALQVEFEKGIAAILADMDDPDKSGTGERALTLKIRFQPTADDERIDIYVESSLKLPNRRATRALAIREGAKLLQYRNTQEELPLARVTRLPTREETGEDQC